MKQIKEIKLDDIALIKVFELTNEHENKYQVQYFIKGLGAQPRYADTEESVENEINKIRYNHQRFINTYKEMVVDDNQYLKVKEIHNRVQEYEKKASSKNYKGTEKEIEELKKVINTLNAIYNKLTK